MKYLEEIEKTIKAAQEIPLCTNYSIEKVKEYVEGLFSFAKFKVGDEVRMASDYPITKNGSPGWWCFRHLLSKGSLATIREVDYRKSTFNYAITFQESTWMDDEGKVHESHYSKGAMFYLEEKWLK